MGCFLGGAEEVVVVLCFRNNNTPPTHRELVACVFFILRTPAVIVWADVLRNLQTFSMCVCATSRISFSGLWATARDAVAIQGIITALFVLHTNSSCTCGDHFFI